MRTELHELVLALITTLMMQGVAFGTILLDHSIGSNKDVRDRSGEEPRCGRSQAGKTRHDTKRRKSIHYNNKKKNNRRRRRRRVTQEEEEKEEEKEEERKSNQIKSNPNHAMARSERPHAMTRSERALFKSHRVGYL